MDKIYNGFKNYEKGLHFYINIANLDYLVKKDETDYDMNHVFHLLNTFLVTLERFVLDNFDGNVEFEKLTGSRIHYFIKETSNINLCFAFLKISKFVLDISRRILAFGKYNFFKSIPIQIGADYGSFVDYNFKDYMSSYEEYTSIGFPANYACKLQILANNQEIIVSNKFAKLLYANGYKGLDLIDLTRANFIYEKYGLASPYLVNFNTDYTCFFESKNPNFKFCVDNNFEHYVSYALNVAEKVNLSDMEKRSPRDISNFSSFSLKNSAYFNGTVMFADVRGFTKQFAPDGHNLLKMSKLTEQILNLMYTNCAGQKGVHVQFQGDREFVIFDDGFENEAVVYALMVSSEVQKIADVSLGVGGNFGRIHAASVGINDADNEIKKQPSILGRMIIKANKLEDEEAGPNEIVISDDLYQKISNPILKKLFRKRKDYWVTGCNYRHFLDEEFRERQEQNHLDETYNPWSY